MDNLEILKGMLTEIAGSNAEIKEGQEEAKETFAKWEERFGKVETRMDELEKAGLGTPRKPKEIELPGAEKGAPSEKTYMGYDLGIQGMGLKRLTDVDSTSPTPILKNYVGIGDEGKKDRIAKFLIDFIGAKVMQDPASITRLREAQVQKTTLGTSVAGTAGYLVPDEYMAEILSFARIQSVALRDCTIVPMGSDTKRVPAESSNTTVAWETTDVDSELDESNPTVAEVVLNAKRLGAFIAVTNDLLDDSMIDIVSWLTSQFSEALGLEMDNQVFAGTGNPVSGITTDICGYSVICAGSISTVTGTDLSSMIAKLSANKTLGAKFYMHRTVFHYIRTLKDSQDAFIYNPIGQAQSNSIWGYPYENSEKMPSTDGSGKPFALFGNLRYFYIGNRRTASTLDADPYGKFTYAQTRFRIYWRQALACGLPDAFVRLLTA